MFPGSYGRGGDQGPLGHSLPAPGTFLPWFLQVAWNHLKGAKVTSVIFKIFFLLATSHFLPSIVGPKTAPFSLEGKEWTIYCCQYQRRTSEVPKVGKGGRTWWGSWGLKWQRLLWLSFQLDWERNRLLRDRCTKEGQICWGQTVHRKVPGDPSSHPFSKSWLPGRPSSERISSWHLCPGSIHGPFTSFNLSKGKRKRSEIDSERNPTADFPGIFQASQCLLLYTVVSFFSIVA